MIKQIKDVSNYLEWIDEYANDKCLSTPFYDFDKIVSTANNDKNLLLAVYDGEELIGIFCLWILTDEKYIETLFLCSRERRAYEELINYLSKQYNGYIIWFVYNPLNDVVNKYLLDKQAYFYEEQRFMQYEHNENNDVLEIIPYCDIYEDAYINIHSKDGYWDGKKVLDNLDRFFVFLCVRDNRLVGYIDFRKGSSVNEIIDILVLPEYRNMGIGTLLLKKAIHTNNGERLILTVDVNNAPANHLYEKIGFKEIPQNNCVTAKFTLLD